MERELIGRHGPVRLQIVGSEGYRGRAEGTVLTRPARAPPPGSSWILLLTKQVDIETFPMRSGALIP